MKTKIEVEIVLAIDSEAEAEVEIQMIEDSLHALRDLIAVLRCHA
jgi:hypothetical protein